MPMELISMFHIQKIYVFKLVIKNTLKGDYGLYIYIKFLTTTTKQPIFYVIVTQYTP